MDRFFLAMKRLWAQADESLPPADAVPRKHWEILMLGVATAVATALSLGQDCTWDVMNYHFYSGYAFITKPLHYDFAAAQRQTFFNPLLHVPSYLLLAHLPSIAVAILLSAVQGVNFYLLFQISQTLFRKWQNPFRYLICLLSAATGCYSSAYILELGTTFGDNLSSLLILTGILLILRYLESAKAGAPVSNLRIGMAGGAFGIALGLKLTVAIYVAAAVVALVSVLFLPHRRIRPLIIFIAFLGLGFAAFYGHWGYSLYREYQSPVFPFMNRFFQSPFFDSANLTDPRFFPRTWLHRYLYPFFFTRENTLVSEIPFRDIRLALCYLAVFVMAGFGVFHIIRKPAQSREERTPGYAQHANLILLTIFFLVAYILWQIQFSVYRYLLVLELLAPAFLTLTLSALLRKKLHTLLFSLTLNAAICAFMVPANFGRQKFDDDFLKSEIPKFRELEKSVVLLSGIGATSFLIPNFPPETRFVRISSSLCNPGENRLLDKKINGMLAGYDAKHTRVLISEEQDRAQMLKQLSFYNVKVDEQSCRPILRRAQAIGYLCEVLPSAQDIGEIPREDLSSMPVIVNQFSVRLETTPAVIVDSGAMHLRLSGLNHMAIDLLYTINGELQPPHFRCFLDRNGIAAFPVNPQMPKGLYHLIGVRSSAALTSEPWIRVNSRLLVR